MNGRTNIYCLLLCVCLAGLALVSCGRKATTQKSDTTIAEKKFAKLLPVDSGKVKSVEKTTDSIFVIIEKECPNLERLPQLRKAIKDKAPAQNRLKDINIVNKDFELRVEYKGDQQRVRVITYNKIITNTKTIHHYDTWVNSALAVWPLWTIPWPLLILIVWAIRRK